MTIALVLVKGLEEKKIVQIACGQQHSIALDADGYGLLDSIGSITHVIAYRLVYVWGYNGYCRLGLGNQKDMLNPQVVPQVSHVLLLSLVCGLIIFLRVQSLQGQINNILLPRCLQVHQILW